MRLALMIQSDLVSDPGVACEVLWMCPLECPLRLLLIVLYCTSRISHSLKLRPVASVRVHQDIDQDLISSPVHPLVFCTELEREMSGKRNTRVRYEETQEG